jgi:hypothetical protein
MNEKWSQKYKRSIDCDNPKGFSQKAHCQGRKKNEMKIEEKLQLFLEKNCPTDSAKWSASKAAAKKKFDVYPCVPLDSLAVTKVGFKTYDELIIGEEILTYNLEKENLEWKPILNLHYYENADLMEIKKPTGFHFRCTPNHKWVVKREFDRKPELVEAKDITTHMRMVFSAKMQESNSNLDLLNENWGKHDTWTERIVNMSKNEREIWLSSAIVYDGWEKGESAKVKGRRTFGFSQKNRDHLLATVYAAYLNGYYVSINDLDRDVVGVTIIRSKDTHGTQNVKKVQLVEKEDVWCPETENHTWVMVQNGWMTITGNSAYANGWAAKNYKSKGGGWKTCAKKESYDPAMGGWVQPSNKTPIENPLDKDKLDEAPCWEGYKQVGMKEKNGKQVPNCVPINENKNMKKIKEEYPDHPERRDKDSEIDYGYVDPVEYDVDNYDDYKDFIVFMREYTRQLNEADCGCVFEAEYQGRKVKLGKPMQGDVKKFKVYVKNDKGNVVKVNFGDPNMRIKKSNPERRKSFRARHNCDSPGPRWKARYWSCRKW